MSKRIFLRSMLAGLGAGMAALPARSQPKNLAKVTSAGPALLTVSGLIGPGNRGALDQALDRLLAKQGVAFSKAHTLDAVALAALPQVTIKPTLEYDGKRHTLQGPSLLDVMKAAGAKVGGKTAFLLRAIDGYAIQLDAAEADKRRFIIATHIDGKPMALGGLGPLWAVYDADQFPDIAAKPLKERFSLCPWATYHVEVREG
ncbi:MAG: molybdopterin-dependent oxidoreductase [Aquabacterium sp.]|uniref:molybdopterin-dependent oxidoreductase n=1 Tax=Aquabacterium sp. TaxID=1872578 RepID=UPI003BB1B684